MNSGVYKATDLRFQRSDTTSTAISRILDACFQQWRLNEGAVLEGQDPEGIHQMRVGIRRFRSALTLFGDLLPEQDLAWISVGAKQTQNELNQARDWDVIVGEMIPPVVAGASNKMLADALHALTDHVSDTRRQGYTSAKAMIESSGYRTFVTRLGAWIGRRGWLDGATPSAAAILDESVRNMATRVLAVHHDKVMSRGFELHGLPPDQRHKLRIALKKLRYAVEFFDSLFDKRRVKPYVKALRNLQDGFGHVNDVAVAERAFESVYTSVDGRQAGVVKYAAGAVVGWYRRSLVDLEPDLLADWERFRKKKPFWSGR